MRPDFSKVLTERPRAGGSLQYKTIRHASKHIEEDEFARKEGMRKPYGYNSKEFTDLIGPLRRFLQSSVGRNWNTVHSEICAVLKGRSTTQQHLLDHIDSYIEINAVIDANKFLRDSTGHGVWKMFYVDPRDGKLKYTKDAKSPPYIRRRGWWSSPYKPNPPDPFNKETKLESGTTARMIDGIWYEITVVDVPNSVYDSTARQWVFHGTRKEERKRQLKTRELKALKLENKWIEDRKKA